MIASLRPDRYFEVLHRNSLSSCFGQTSKICVPFFLAQINHFFFSQLSLEYILESFVLLTLCGSYNSISTFLDN